MKLEFTTRDLLMARKKVADVMQELTDYVGNAEDAKEEKVVEYLNNSIASLSDAEANIDQAIIDMDVKVFTEKEGA